MHNHIAREANRHGLKALTLFNEANVLLKECNSPDSARERLDLMEQVIRKDIEAIAETEEAVKCQNELIYLQKEFLNDPKRRSI